MSTISLDDLGDQIAAGVGAADADPVEVSRFESASKNVSSTLTSLGSLVGAVPKLKRVSQREDGLLEREPFLCLGCCASGADVDGASDIPSRPVLGFEADAATVSLILIGIGDA
jgi:hypothetical protein